MQGKTVTYVSVEYATIIAIDTILKENILEANRQKGDYLLQGLVGLSREHSIIGSPRGKGLMCGFNLVLEGVEDYKEAGNEFCRVALENGLLLQHCNNGQTIRLLPNYMIQERDIDYLFEILDFIIRKHYTHGGK